MFLKNPFSPSPLESKALDGNQTRSLPTSSSARSTPTRLSRRAGDSQQPSPDELEEAYPAAPVRHCYPAAGRLLRVPDNTAA